MRFIIVTAVCLIITGVCQARSLTLVTLDSAPMEFVRDNKVTGRNVEIARLALKRMGLDCQVRIVPWKRALVMVERGTADAIIDAARNPERETYLYFPEEPIYVEEWYGFKLANRIIHLDKDLGNARQFSMGASRGFEYGGMIQKAIDQGWFKSIEDAVDAHMNIHKLLADRFDFFIGVKATTFYLIKQKGYAGKIDRVPMTETGKPYLLNASPTYVAFSKQTIRRDMADQFSRVLENMKAEGVTNVIEAQFYRSP